MKAKIIGVAVCCLAVAVGQVKSEELATASPSVGGQGARSSEQGARSEERKAQKKQAKANRVRGATGQPGIASAGGVRVPKGNSKPNHVTDADVNAGNANAAHDDKRVSYDDAVRRCVRERHDRSWWKRHYTVIVVSAGGCYYWDAGYWFPAWGYDPGYAYYEYNGPIYTYGNLLPDQVIVNVQRALQQLGYYGGRLNGSLGPVTRQAIAAYQADAGLIVNGVVDGPTVEALGLI